MKELCPAHLTENTLETLPALRPMRFSWIYWILLAGVTLAFASLPFIHLDVGVRAPAMIRPAAEKAAGITLSKNFSSKKTTTSKRNKPSPNSVRPPLENKSTTTANGSKKKKSTAKTSTLRWIIAAAKDKNAPQLRQTIWQESLRQYQSIRQEGQTRIAEASREESRAQALFADQLLSKTDLEKAAGQRAQVSIDAFPTTEWERLQGMLLEISMLHCEWPLETFQADGELARSMKVLKISSDINTITLSTDERGRIFFPVQGDLRRENLRIRIVERDKFKKIKKFHVMAPQLSEMRVNDNFAGTVIHPQKMPCARPTGSSFIILKKCCTKQILVRKNYTKSKNLLQSY